MWCFLNEILSTHTNHFDTDTFACCNTHLNVLFNLESVHLGMFIDGSSIQAILVDTKQKLAHDDTVVKGVEDTLRVRGIDWNSTFTIFVIFQSVIDKMRVCSAFFM